MIGQRLNGFGLILTIIDAALAWSLYWLCYWWVFQAGARNPVDPQQYWNYSFLIVLVVAFMSFRRVAAPGFALRIKTGADFDAAFQTAACAGFALLLFMSLNKDTGISRWFVFVYSLSLMCLLSVSGAALPGVVARLAFSSQRCPTVILTCGDAAREVAEWARARADYGLDLLGFIGESRESAIPDNFPMLGYFDELDSILARTPAALLVVADAPSSGWNYEKLKCCCDFHGARLIISNLALTGLRELIWSAESGIGIQMLSFRSEPLEHPSNRLVKRAFDILVSLPVILFVLPPLVVVVAIVQARQSPGPLFFRQVRVGRHQRNFNILKFRTMHARAFDESVQTSVDDDRVYPAGRLLRRFSIDEFPQFINVLRGEMSIVGPRPHLPQHEGMFAKATGYYKVRSLIKPGITGLAQIQGFRGEIRTTGEIEQRTNSDLIYLENWSLLLDVIITLRTAWQAVRPPKTAY